MHFWTLTDLYLVGIALEIIGGAILAKGLFLSPREIAGMVELYPGPDLAEAAERIGNRVDAEFGLGYLLMGFTVQAVGYGVELAGVHSATGTCRLLAALALSAGITCIAWLAWYLLRGRRVEALAAGVKADLERRNEERGES